MGAPEGLQEAIAGPEWPLGPSRPISRRNARLLDPTSGEADLEPVRTVSSAPRDLLEQLLLAAEDRGSVVVRVVAAFSGRGRACRGRVQRWLATVSSGCHRRCSSVLYSFVQVRWPVFGSILLLLRSSRTHAPPYREKERHSGENKKAYMRELGGCSNVVILLL